MIGDVAIEMVVMPLCDVIGSIGVVHQADEVEKRIAVRCRRDRLGLK